MKCISGAHTLLQAGPEPGGVHAIRLSPASIDVKVRERQMRTSSPVDLVR